MAKKCVLHADDVEQWRVFVSDALADACQVESVNSCDDVLPRLAKGGIDLVVLDLLMPGQSPDASGFEVLENIRKDFPSMPVMMFTGATQDTDETSEGLSEKWKVPVVFKDDTAIANLSQKVTELLS